MFHVHQLAIENRDVQACLNPEGDCEISLSEPGSKEASTLPCFNLFTEQMVLILLLLHTLHILCR